jgi:hypothetical protein
MATLDSTREELGWLKVVFTIVAAVDVSLVAWVSQAYETARGPLLLIAIVAATLITAAALWINQHAYRKIRELRDL